jgi:predicted TIM-barrel fold metal-dependent hydrolase
MTDVRLEPAPATKPGDVIDAHMHLFSVAVFEEFVAANPEAAERFQKAARDKRFGRRNESLPDLAAAEMAPWYVERIHDAGLAKALVVSVLPDSQYIRDVIAAANGHISALCNVDPRDPGAPALLEREMAAGFKGVKLLASNRCYRLSDPACRPFLEKAAELGAHMIIHYGVTVDPTGDRSIGSA